MKIKSSTQDELVKENLLLEKKLAEYKEALFFSETKRKDIQEIGLIGEWENDIESKTTIWSDLTYRIFGYEPFEAKPEEIFAQNLHPEDKHVFWEVVKNAWHGNELIIPESNFRIIDKKGELHYCNYRGKIITDRKGNKIKAIGTIQDITQRKREELARIESEKLFYQALDVTPVGFALFDKTNKIKYLNRRFTELFGYTIEDIPTVDLWFPLAYPDPVYRKDIAEKWVTEIERYLTTKDQFNPIIGIVTCKDGSLKDIEFRFEVTGTNYISTFVDITGYKKAIRAYQESEEKYRSLVAALPSGVIMQDSKGEIITANKSAEIILGRSIETIKGKSSIDFNWQAIHEDGSDFSREQRPAMVTLRTGKPVKDVIMGLRNPEGRLIWISINSQPIFRSREKKPYAVVTSFTDVTQERNVQKILQESEERFKKLSSLTFEGIVIHKGPICIDANNSFCNIFGYTLEELKGKDLLPILICKEFRDMVIQKMEQEFIQPYEIQVMRKDGMIIPVEVESQNILWNNENVKVSALRDITEKNKVRNALEESELRYKTLTDVTSEGIVIHNNGYIVDANPSAVSMFGDYGGDLIGSSIFKFIEPGSHETVKQRIKEKYSGVYEVEMLRSNGTYFPVELITKNLLVEGQALRVVTINDITLRKAAEMEIRRLSTAVVQSPVSIVITDLKGNITYANPRFETVTGYQVDEVMGANPRVLKSGKTDDAVYGDLWNTIKTGKTWQGEFINKRKDGSFYWETATISPITDSKGNIINYLAVKEDITDRKNAEETLKNTLLELERSNKDLEQFAFVSSHDLQEPLRKIKNYTEILASKYHELFNEQTAEYLNIIVRGTARMQLLIDDLLSYSRVSSQAKVFSKVNMDLVIDDVLDSLELAIFKVGAEIIRAKLPEIKVDKGQIYIVFQNLISNALKFKGEAKPIVEIAAEETPSHWQFSIKDNGIGIHMKYAEKIFIVFQRLHSRTEYEGTGIGLAICKKIVERHQGSIWFESTPGKGTTFRFTISKRLN